MAYTEVTVSGYNASPPPDDGSAVAANEVTWAGIKTKIGDPIKTAFDTCQTNITAVVSTEIEVNLWAPATTAMVFNQTAAPTNWTKATTHNDKALRVVTGTASSGGATAFTSVFGSAKTTGAHTLTSTEIPSHTHSFSATTGNNSVSHTHSFSDTFTTSSDGAHTHTYTITNQDDNYSSVGGSGDPGTSSSASTGSDGAHTHTGSVSGTTGADSVSHTHSVSGTTGSAGSGGSHTHTLSLDLQYVDVIIATKDA